MQQRKDAEIKEELKVWQIQRGIDLIAKHKVTYQKLLDKEISENMAQNYVNIVNVLAKAVTQTCRKHSTGNENSNPLHEEATNLLSAEPQKRRKLRKRRLCDQSEYTTIC